MSPRASRPRLAASLVCAATLTTSLGATTVTSATPAFAAAATATAAPLRFALPTTDTATDILAVGNEVWVAAGNTILIASTTGKVRRTITGVYGAQGLTLAPDRQSVYASSSTSAKIMQFSTVGDAQGSWTSQPCPGTSAVAAGALYYAHGCDSGTRGVARLDLDTHTDTSVLTSWSAGAVTAGGSTVVTYMPSGSGYDLTSYAIGADGGLTKNASIRTDATYDAEISPDGTKVIATNYGSGYGVARYDATTLAPAGTFSTGPYPSAVAWSPDGSLFAGALTALYDAPAVMVFSSADGSTVTRSTDAGNTPFWNDAHKATWSPDGKLVFTLSQDQSKPAYLVVTPARGQARTALAVNVVPAGAYGKNLTVRVRAANRPRTAVTLTVTQNGAVTRRTVTTDATGAATWSLPARAAGTVAATVAGDQSFLAASSSAKFATPSGMNVGLSGASRVVNGVAHYPSLARVRGTMWLLPKRTGKVVVSLQHRSGSAWATDQTATFTADASGTVQLGLLKGGRKVTYRFVARAVADSTAGASPSVATKPFVVD